MAILKNARHERFAQLLASGIDATNAHEQAGFARNTGNACELKQDERVRTRVNELLQERATIERRASEKAVERVALSKEWVLARLIENVERGLQARQATDEEGNPIGDFKYDGGVVNKALELLGKEQGMFIERKEQGRPGDFTAMDEQAVREVAAQQLEELGLVDAAAALRSGQDIGTHQPTAPGGDAVN